MFHCSSLSFGPQTLSGSATTSPTMRRGFSDEIGSWKIICRLVRLARIASESSATRSSPSRITDPARRPGNLQDGLARGGLAAARLADESECLATRHVEADPTDCLDGAFAPGVELDHEVVDLQEYVLGGTQVCGSGSSHQTDSSSVARSLPIAASAGGYSLAMLVSNAAWPSGVPTGK